MVSDAKQETLLRYVLAVQSIRTTSLATKTYKGSTRINSQFSGQPMINNRTISSRRHLPGGVLISLEEFALKL